MKNREEVSIHTHGMNQGEDGVWREPHLPVSYEVRFDGDGEEIELEAEYIKKKLGERRRLLAKATEQKLELLIIKYQMEVDTLELHLAKLAEENSGIEYVPEIFAGRRTSRALTLSN